MSDATAHHVYVQLTPKQTLRLGAFGTKYMTDCRGEFQHRFGCR